MMKLMAIIDTEALGNTEYYTTAELNVFARLKNQCLYLLEEEKKNIVDAYKQGQYDAPVEGRAENIDPEEYYTQTFKQ